MVALAVLAVCQFSREQAACTLCQNAPHSFSLSHTHNRTAPAIDGCCGVGASELLTRATITSPPHSGSDFYELKVSVSAFRRLVRFGLVVYSVYSGGQPPRQPAGNNNNSTFTLCSARCHWGAMYASTSSAHLSGALPFHLRSALEVFSRFSFEPPFLFALGFASHALLPSPVSALALGLLAFVLIEYPSALGCGAVRTSSVKQISEFQDSDLPLGAD